MEGTAKIVLGNHKSFWAYALFDPYANIFLIIIPLKDLHGDALDNVFLYLWGYSEQQRQVVTGVNVE